MKKVRYIHLFSLFTLSLTACGSKGLKSVSFVIATLGTSVNLHTEAQNAFINSDNPDLYIEEHESEMLLEDHSKPMGVSFSWTTKANNNEQPLKYTLRVDEVNGNDSFIVDTENTSITLYNFKKSEEYTYTVTAEYKNKSFTSEEKSFKTDDTKIRGIYVNGLQNIRDLGGWDLENGKTYKQGLIYRSCELNSDKYDRYKFSDLNEEGISTMLNDLHIKSEIDLRKTKESFNSDEVLGITSSPLGDSVEYVSLPMMYRSGVYGNNIFNNNDNKPRIKSFFEYLANENNYPIVFHCVRGTDRTGALAYALGALLGMNKQDLMLDYLYSNFARIKDAVREETILADDFYVQGIDNEVGNTISEKAQNYLINKIGVEQSTLNSIISILSE